MKTFVLLAISLAFIFTSCNKENDYSKDDDFLKTSAMEDVDMMFKGDLDGFEKVITKPLVKIENCKFIVEGTIEFHKADELIAIFDFGNGDCDDIATKTVDGITTEFSLKKLWKKGKYQYEKVMVEPIVKVEGCDYIVSGIVEFYKEDVWVATIDFGDGTCDEWATKTWDGSSKEFSMKK